MKPAKQGRTTKGTHGKQKARHGGKLSAHPAFAPLFGLWGALLGGLPVMVLPAGLVTAATRGSFVGSWDIPLQPVLAMLSGTLVGTALFVAARLKSGGLRPGVSLQTNTEAAARCVLPIDPVRDLGTRSIDDPIDTVPFAIRARRDTAFEAEAAREELAAVAEEVPAPRALDLAEFAQLPGRDAVWVEEPAAPESDAEPELLPLAAPVTELGPAASALPAPGTAALARLRAVPPSELSLAEMVERFAAALHEHRETPPARVLGGADFAAREAALAEALKALAALSGCVATGGAAAESDAPLRAALAQFQTSRGAA